MKAGKSSDTKKKSRHLVNGFRWRTVLLVAAVYLFSFCIVSASIIYLTKSRGDEELSAALVQGVTSFGFGTTRDFEVLSDQAKIFAADPVLRSAIYETDGGKPSELVGAKLGAGKAVAGKTSKAGLNQGKVSGQVGQTDGEKVAVVLNASLKDYVLTELTNTYEDLLIVVDGEGGIKFGVERPSVSSEEFGALGTPSEVKLEKDEEAAPADKAQETEIRQESTPAELGLSIDIRFLESLFKFGEISQGYMRFGTSKSAPIFAVVAVPLEKGSQSGALLLGKRIDSKVLAKWSQGMPSGLVAIAAQDSVVMAFDNRSSSRPTPMIAAELDKLFKAWSPRQAIAESGKGGSKLQIVVCNVSFAGEAWKASAVELSTGKKQEPLGDVVFLADPMNLKTEMDQHVWVLGGCLLITLILQSALVYWLSPLCLHFAKNHWESSQRFEEVLRAENLQPDEQQLRYEQVEAVEDGPESSEVGQSGTEAGINVEAAAVELPGEPSKLEPSEREKVSSIKSAQQNKQVQHAPEAKLETAEPKDEPQTAQINATAGSE